MNDIKGKRFLTLALTLALVLGCGGFISVAQSRDAVLFDSNWSDAGSALGTDILSLNTQIVYEGSKQSLEFDFSKGGNWFNSSRLHFAERGIITDFRPYGSLNIRIYNEVNNGSKMNLILTKEPDTDDQGYLMTQLTFDFEGWKDISVPLSSFDTARELYSVAQIGGMWLNVGGWGSTVVSDTKFYLDKIWLSDDSQNDSNVIFNANDTKAGSMLGMRVQSMDTQTVYEGSHQSLRFDMSRANGYSTDRILLADHGILTDWSGYDYLNVRVFCPEEKGSALNIIASKDAGTDDSGYYREEINFDFSGWQEIRLPLRDFEANRGMDSWQQMGALYFNAGGWGVTYDSTLVFYLDKIWLSAAEGVDYAENVIFGADAKGAETAFGTVVNALNTQITYPPSEHSLEFDFGKSSRWYNSERYQLESHGALTDWSGYEALSFRIYSPREQSGQMNIICAKDIADDNQGYYQYTINFNFSGWQEIKIPLEDFSLSRSDPFWNTVKAMYFNIGGWNTTYDSTLLFYLDSIWLEKDEGGQEEPGEAENIWHETIIFNANDDRAQSLLGSVAQVSEDIVHESSHQSILLDMSRTSGSATMYDTNRIVLENQGTTQDWSQYDTINMRVYNETALNGEALMVASRDADTSDNGYYFGRYSLNFTGWKVIELPLSSFEGVRGITGWSQIGAFYLDFGGWETLFDRSMKLYIDRIWLSKGSSTLAVESVSYPNGYNQMPVQDEELHIATSLPLSSAGLDSAVTLTKGDVAAEGMKAVVEGNVVKISFQKALEAGQAYTLHLGQLYDLYGQKQDLNFTYRFQTEDICMAGRPVFLDAHGNELETLPQQGTVIASVEILQAGVNLGVAVCSDSGQILQLLSSQESNADATLQVSVDAADISGGSLKAFVYETGGGLARNGVAVLGAEKQEVSMYPLDAPASAGGPITMDSPSMMLDTLHVAGALSSPAPHFILLQVYDQQDQCVLMDVAKNNQDGRYEATFQLGGESGLYRISAISLGQTTEQTVSYTGESDREAIVKAVNEGTREQIQEQFPSWASAFGLCADMEEERTNHIALVLYEHRPYSTFSQLFDMATKATELLDALNQCSWSALDEFLEENAAYVLPQSEQYGKYTAFSEKNQHVVNQSILSGAPFSGFEAFRTKFDAVVSAYQESSGNGGTGSGGGSGGSSNRPSSSGSSQMMEVYTQPQETPDENAFSDLEQANWAKDSIEYLYELGVIAPAQDMRFRPLDFITRAEFVKLLSAAFDLQTEAECTYTDIDPSDWHYPYVAAATTLGIAKGYPDGSFSPDEIVSRQDMAVMVQRCLEVVNQEPATGQSETFADEDAIAAYAKEAVTKLCGAGILKGMGDGRFAPEESTNRAQAAVVIARLLRGASQ